MAPLIKVAHLQAQSAPAIQNPVIVGNLITMTCSSVPGDLYQFQRATNLISGSNAWSDLGSFIVATNNAVSISDFISPYLWAEYYQVKEIPSNLVVNISTIASVSYTGSPYVFINGDFESLVFTSSGTFTVNAGSSGPVESLVVAGGGGGGYSGGGGGAGGLIHTSLFVSPAYSAGTYNIVVGAGGEGFNHGTGNNGGNSSFGNSTVGEIVAMGGGGGAGFSVTGGNANTGGSGGGGAPTGVSMSSLLNGASSVQGTQYGISVAEGNGGGNAIDDTDYPEDLGGGGGGGAGGPGFDATSMNVGPPFYYYGTGGNGGNGLPFQMTGSPTYDTWYSGGGGGPGPPGNTTGQGQDSGRDRAGGGGPSTTSGQAGIVILRFKYQ